MMLYILLSQPVNSMNSAYLSQSYRNDYELFTSLASDNVSFRNLILLLRKKLFAQVMLSETGPPFSERSSGSLVVEKFMNHADMHLSLVCHSRHNPVVTLTSASTPASPLR